MVRKLFIDRHEQLWRTDKNYIALSVYYDLLVSNVREQLSQLLLSVTLRRIKRRQRKC